MQSADIPSGTEHDLETLLRCAREEIRFLRKKCESVDIYRLNSEMWQTDNIRLKAENAQLLAQHASHKLEMEKVQTRLDQMEKRLGQDSNNSSKPPSSDPLYKKRRLAAPVGSKRKPGGQPGHEKHEQQILPTKDVREVIPKECEHCQASLEGTDPQPKLRQHIEIPPINPKVTHFLVHQIHCRRCGKVTRGKVSTGMRSGYGSRLEALVSHLTGTYRFSKRKTVSFLGEMYGIPLSLGMLCKMQERTSLALEGTMAEIDALVLNSSEPLSDETGERIQLSCLSINTRNSNQKTIFFAKPGNPAFIGI